MGIETLIVFIAMILVSAVAAGVLLKTVGALQQRSLAVGNEARTRISAGLDIVQVTGIANLTTFTSNQIEVLFRLQPGSYDISMETTSFTFNSYERFYTARMMSRSMEAYRYTDIRSSSNTSRVFLDNETWVEVVNLDFDETDTENEYVSLTYNVSGDQDGLRFRFSSDVGDIIVLLQNENGTAVDIEDDSGVNVQELPIIDYREHSLFGQAYGFITLNGTLNDGPDINISENNLTFRIETDIDKCNWNKVPTNHRFCTVAKVGDSDNIAEQGELLALRYKLDSSSSINKDTNFDLSFIPKGGRIVELLVYSPEVFSRRVLRLWP